MSQNKRPLLPYPEKFKTRFLNLNEVWSIAKIKSEDILKAAIKNQTELCVAVPSYTPFRLSDADRFNSSFGIPASTKKPNYLTLSFEHYHSLLECEWVVLKESSLGFLYQKDSTCEVLYPSACHEEVVNHPERKFDYREWQNRWTDWVLRDDRLVCTLNVCLDDVRIPCFNLLRYIEFQGNYFYLSEVKRNLENHFHQQQPVQQPSVPNAEGSVLSRDESSKFKVDLNSAIIASSSNAQKVEPELSVNDHLKVDVHPSIKIEDMVMLKQPRYENPQNQSKKFGEKTEGRNESMQDMGSAEKRSFVEQKSQHAISSTESLLKISQVSERTGLSESSIDNFCNPKSPYYDPTFPKKRKQGMRSIAWFESEVTEWVRARNQN